MESKDARIQELERTVTELLVRLRSSGGQRAEPEQDLDTRVDGERRAAGPAGSTAASNEAAPAAHLIELAIRVSTWSPCRSKRGSVIFDRDDNIVAHGNNYKPQGFECDGSAECKSTCRRDAIHAEQRALLAAGHDSRGCEMLHVKTIDGQLVPSGGPSCEQCSKLALAAGVVSMWLYHEDGWRRYGVSDWHRLSLEAATKRDAVDPVNRVTTDRPRATDPLSDPPVTVGQSGTPGEPGADGANSKRTL